MRKATKLLLLGIIPALFTFSVFGQCPTLALTYPQEVALNSTVTLQASGCQGEVSWYLTNPKNDAPVLYSGNNLLYPIEKETTFYAACQLEDGTLCKNSVAQATIKVSLATDNSPSNISPSSYFRPSPTATAFVRYGEIPVSYHTGLVNQDMPIYTVECKDVSLGLSISNHGSGNKVADVSSWVGLGMSLNTGGVLTRTVQGAPDEGQGNPISTGYYARSQAGSYYPSYINGQYSNVAQWAIPRPANYPNNPTATDCNSTVSQDFKDALDGKIDTEPDLFFFKIGDYSGKFMFDSLAVAHFLPQQDIKVAVVFNASTSVFEQFILTAPNGMKYYFGGTHGSIDFPQGSNAVEKTHTDPTFPVSTAWYLTKIEAADSQSRIFLSYQSEQYAYFDLKQESIDYQNGWQGGFNPSQDFVKNRFLGVRLTNIYTSDKNTQINFIADSLRKDVGDYTLGEYSLGYSEAKYLNEIQVLHGTNGMPPTGIKRFVLKHNYFEASEGNVLNSFKPLLLRDNPTFFKADRKRLRLLSLQEKSWDGNTVIPAYQFKYDSTISFPRRLCYSQDHWGYYNGNEYIGSGVNNSLMHIENGDGIQGIPTAFLNGLTWNSNRSTNPVYIGFGALIKIIYPTSGYTVFEYGNHQRGSFAPSLNIGGLRINSISNYDADGTRLTKKQFDYLSSGILYTRPTYYYQASQISFPCGSGSECYPAGCPVGIASSATLLPLSSTQGSHFGYQQVKVIELNANDVATNGYRIYSYNTDLPTIDVMNPSSYDDFGALRAYNYPLNPVRENYRQGTVALEEVINSNDKLVSKTSYAYQYSSKIVPIPAMKVDNHTIGNIPGTNHYYNFYRFKTGRSELRSKTTTQCQDDGTNCIASKETYEYSSPTHFQMTRMSQSMSNGDSLINTYKYSYDYAISPSVTTLDAASDGIKSLKLKKMLVPIEELSLHKSLSGNVVVMNGELTQYDATALKPSAKYLLEVTNPFLALSSFVPSSIISSGNQATFNKDSHYPIQANIAFLYNNLGNVAQVEQPQGSSLVRSLLWGYGGSYPIAEIKNATYASVQTALSPAVITNLETSNNLSDAQIKSQLAPIWNIPNSLSSIYTYLPLRGISSIMSANQLNTSFFYDDLTRLIHTKDHDDNKVTEYSYSYDIPNRITTTQYRVDKNGFPYSPQSTQDVYPTNNLITHEYFDGLGRFIQKIGERRSPSVKDIVYSTQTYDTYGRNKQQIIAFPSDKSDGTYQSNFLNLAQSYYRDSKPYSTNVYETSPLSQNRETFGVGSAWHDANKRWRYFDETAGDTVRYYTVDIAGNISKNGFYPSKSLFQKRTLDEQGNTTIEITDQQGRLIQRQQQNATDWLTTYYINDALGRVLAILQPNAYALNSNILQNSVDWKNGVFFYNYDNQGRVAESHVPNGGFTRTVYDQADREVLSQDAYQQTLDRWTFTKYDNLNRTILSGEINNNDSRSTLQGQFDTQSTISETFDSTLAQQLYYTDVSFPFSVDSSKAMIVNFYDNYSGWRLGSYIPFDSNPYPNATGLLTGALKRVTQTGEFLLQSFYYNNKNRWIYSRKQVSLINIPIPITNFYFFDGALASTDKLIFSPTQNVNYYKNYSYDFAARKTSTVFLVSNIRADITYDYDEIGRLKQKKIQPYRQYGVADTGADFINRPPALEQANTEDIANKAVIISAGFMVDAADSINTQTYLAEIDTTQSSGLTDALQTINYDYHIRGQVNCINCRKKQVNIGNKENDLFSMKLAFEEDKRYYDGNISKQIWKNPLIDNNQQYKHSYDGTSRLVKSLYRGGVSGSNYSLDSVAYDRNGNIQLLKRQGTGGLIDNLSYTYNGNQLLKVADSGTPDGFKDGTNTDDDYGYWANGALKYDRNKGIDSIVYNSYLKKVSRVKFTNGNWINFYYDAAGTLLKRNLSDGNEWIYIEELLLKNKKIYQLNHDEGRAVYDTINKEWNFEFDYRDHQGNLRLSFRDSLAAPINGVYAPPVIVQVNDYDPWGMILGQISHVNSQSKINNFDYSNRERQTDFGLDVMQLGARMYDPTVPRFWSIDPLIEAGQHSFTPYHYSFNNPIFYSDPNGLLGEGCCQSAIDFAAGFVLTSIDNNSPVPISLAGDGYRSYAYSLGAKVGNIASVVTGAAQVLAGVVGDAAAGSAEVVTVGAATPLAVPLAVGSTATIANGIATITKAVTNLNSEGTKNKGGGDKKSNVSSGNKNSSHANQKARDSAQQRYENTKAEYDKLKTKPNKTQQESKEVERLKKQVTHEKQKMDNTGENHSRKAKGSN